MFWICPEISVANSGVSYALITRSSRTRIFVASLRSLPARHRVFRS
jgi:hypothetical protein